MRFLFGISKTIHSLGLLMQKQFVTKIYLLTNLIYLFNENMHQ